MALTKTEYVQFPGKAYWARLYQPDEFRGAVRWGLDLVMDDKEAWDEFKKLGIQKKVKENENGKFFATHRPTTKLMKGKLVYFAPPVIYDKDGKVLVKYVDENDKDIRSFDDKETTVRRVGEPVLIGNGSSVVVTLSVYPTGMGTGNRLESVKIVDLIEYKKPETPAEIAREIEVREADEDKPF